MEELPGGRGSRCVASRRRIEAPAAFHVLTYHPTSSMPSCRIDGMRSSKGADRPASRSLAGPLTPSWRNHRTSLRRRGTRACGGWGGGCGEEPSIGVCKRARQRRVRPSFSAARVPDDEPRLMGWPRVAGNLERFRYRLPDLKHSIQTSPVEQPMQRRVYAA